MIPADVIIFLGLNIACVHAAQTMAMRRRRSRRVWMWVCALLGPAPLTALYLLPHRAAR